MVHVSRAKRLGLLFITAGLTLGVGDLAAQAKQANAAQHTPTTPKDAAEPAAVVAQTQANSANSTARQQHPQRKAPTFRQRVWRWVWRFARDPIAVLTLALFGLGGWQVEISRRTAKAQLRAYLIADPKGILDLRPKGSHQALVRVTNVGQTPAHDISASVAAWVRPFNIDFDPHADALTIEPRVTDQMLGPGRDFTIYGNFGPMKPKEEKDIRDEKLAVFVYGFVHYRDVFNKTRVTVFCHYYRGEELNESAAKYWNVGNSAT